MRHRTALLTLLTLTIACSKDDSSAPSSSSGGGGSGGGDNNGSAHISSWSPAIPYADDTITFHGTGFDAMISGNLITTCSRTFEVISASATQLQAHLVDDITSCILYTDRSTILFHANNWTDTLTGFQWKKVPRITEINYFAPFYCDALFRSGDSLEVKGFGFGPHTFTSISIGGNSVNGTTVVDTGSLGYGYFRARLLPTDLGSSNDECDTATVLVTITNTDGRVFHAQSRIGHGPHMLWTSIVPNISSASRAQLIANNEVIYATVNGRYLKTCMTVRLALSGTPSLTIGGPTPGFPNSYVIGPFDPSALSVGTYYFHPADCDGIIGFPLGSFILTP